MQLAIHRGPNLRPLGKIVLSMALSLFMLVSASADTLNLVVQPMYDEERAKEVYRPLIEYLNRTTPHTINLKTERSFHHYWARMRSSEDYDLVFDDAHFTDYRIQRFAYVPLVKSADNVSFAMLAGYGLDNESLRGLIGRRIATMPAPSLGFALISRWFSQPLQQPVVISSARAWTDTVEFVFAQEADAAMVPGWLAERYPNLAPISRTEEFPGPAVSASPNVSETARQDIADALLKMHEDESVYEALVELNISRFEAASATDFEGYGELLSVFYGY